MNKIVMDIVSICLLVLSLVVIDGQKLTDDRWIHHPNLKVSSVIEGLNITWEWEYRDPGDKEGRLLLTHPIDDEDDSFSYLIDAYIHPVTGYTKPANSLRTDKVALVVTGTTIRITLLSIQFADIGLYSLHLKFDDSPILYDISVQVYAQPEIMENPGTEISRTTRGHVTLRYVFNDSEPYPLLTSVTLALVPTQLSSIIVLVEANIDLETKQWQVTYPDEQLHFEDRITFRHNVQDRQMEVVLWELAVDDSGKLILSANYGNNLVTVKSETSLRVEDKGFQWLEVPSMETYSVLSSGTNLTFTAKHEIGIPIHAIKYKMYKLSAKGVGQEILHLVANISEKTQTVVTSERISCSHHSDANLTTLTVVINDMTLEDAGQYLMNMFYGNLIVLTRTFKLNVLNDEDLVPDIQLGNRTLDLNNMTTVQTGGNYGFFVPRDVPAASMITIYTEGDHEREEHCKGYDTRGLVTNLTAKQISTGIVLLVDYHFHTTTIKLGGPSVKVGESTGMSSDPCSSQTSTHVLVMYNLVLVVMCCLLLLLLTCWIMCAKQVKRQVSTWQNGCAHVNRRKTSIDI